MFASTYNLLEGYIDQVASDTSLQLSCYALNI
jgi:hypothetical protein